MATFMFKFYFFLEVLKSGLIKYLYKRYCYEEDYFIVDFSKIQEVYNVNIKLPTFKGFVSSTVQPLFKSLKKYSK